jgi:signal peptidase I
MKFVATFLLLISVCVGAYQFHRVTGSSMHPAIVSGQGVVSNSAIIWEQVQVGDVIIYKHPAMRIPLCHRVIEAQDNNGIKRLRTKGDNNRSADRGWVYESQYIATVTHVEGLSVWQ